MSELSLLSRVKSDLFSLSSLIVTCLQVLILTGFFSLWIGFKVVVLGQDLAVYGLDPFNPNGFTLDQSRAKKH